MLKNSINKKLLLVILMSSLISTAKFPINSNLNLKMGYQRNEISKEEFKKLGLDDLVIEDFKYNTMNISLNADVLYRKSFDKHILKVGLGGSIDYNINILENEKAIKTVEPISTEEKGIELTSLEMQNDELVADYDSFLNKYNLIYKNVKDLVFDILKQKDAMKKIKEKSAELKELKEKYPTEDKVEELKVSLAENEKKKVQLNSEKDSVSSEIESLNSKDEKSEEDTQKLEELKQKRLSLHKQIDDTSITILEQEIAYKTLERYDEIKEKNDSKRIEVKARMEVLNEIKEKMIEKYTELAGEFDESEYTFEDFETLKEEYREKYDENFTEEERIKDEYLDLLKKYRDKKAYDSMKEYSFNVSTISGSIYSKIAYEYLINNDLKLFTNMQLGIGIEEPISYKIAKDMENNNVKVNGTSYVIPINVKNHKIVPKLDFSLGISYKSMKFGIYAGIQKNIGLEMGYEF